VHEQFASDEARLNRYSLEAAGLNLDYSKNRINQATVKLLCELVCARNLPVVIQTMFNNEHVNYSKNRPALRNFSGNSF